MNEYINVIGAGLAGSEAAYQIAKRGIKVKLYEMKPNKFSPAHSNSNLQKLYVVIHLNQITYKCMWSFKRGAKKIRLTF